MSKVYHVSTRDQNITSEIVGQASTVAYIKEDMEVNEKIGLCNHGILLSLLPPIIIITVTMRIQFAEPYTQAQ